MPSVVKPVKPLSPDDFKQRLPGVKDAAVDGLVDYINTLLTTLVRDFQANGFIDVTDYQNSPVWRNWSSNAVQKFRDAGWRVEELAGSDPIVYRFFLPQ